MHALLAQTEIAAAGAEMLKAQELMPYLKGTIALAFAAVVFFFYKWQACETAMDLERKAIIDRQNAMIERMTPGGHSKEDSRA